MLKEKDGTESNNESSMGKKLLTYSMTAGVVLAVAQPAGGAIQYSGVRNIPVDSKMVSIDMNEDGANDFYFFAGYSPTYSNAWIAAAKISKNQVLASTNGGFKAGMRTAATDEWPRNLSQGYPIGPGNSTWVSAPDDFLHTQKGQGNFFDTQGYIGVRFDINKSGPYYGWIQYEFHPTSKKKDAMSGGTIIDWAYEDNQEKMIPAGDEGFKPIPALNQWGLIILAGLVLAEGGRRLAKRRKEK